MPLRSTRLRHVSVPFALRASFCLLPPLPRLFLPSRKTRSGDSLAYNYASLQLLAGRRVGDRRPDVIRSFVHRCNDTWEITLRSCPRATVNTPGRQTEFLAGVGCAFSARCGYCIFRSIIPLATLESDEGRMRLLLSLLLRG